MSILLFEVCVIGVALHAQLGQVVEAVVGAEEVGVMEETVEGVLVGLLDYLDLMIGHVPCKYEYEVSTKLSEPHLCNIFTNYFRKRCCLLHI